MNKEVNWIKNTEGEITSCNITEEITIEQLKKSFLNEWKEEALKSQREEIVEEIEKILTRHSNWKPTCGYESEIIEIVQKEIAESDKYTIAPLQRIMSNLIKEDETN